MNRTCFRLAPIFLFALMASAPVAAQPPVPYKTGVDSTYVHRINLLDRDGNLLDAGSTAPYSPARTCGKCHDYDRISMGRHFEAGFPGVGDGRPGEPWLLWDAATGTQVPLSHRGEAPARPRPKDLGLTDWEFALRFGRHHPGGGPLEWLLDGKRRDEVEETAPEGGAATGDVSAPHWRTAGALEIDCLLCHAATGYSTFDRFYYLVKEESFRWAPTAAAGLGVVRGSAKGVGAAAAAPDFTPREPRAPAVRYDPARFDPDGRVTFDITRHPPSKNCLFCHATRVPGADPSFPERDLDVHLALGMSCTTCHRNDIHHHITRGDGSAEDLARHPGATTLTCKGCHEDGRLGAPGIEHRGLPAFHLEKLSCTVCHSGPLPRPEVGPLQTARAHGLGLITFEDLNEKKRPAVQAPFYQPDHDGVIRPHAAVWPAWWAEIKNGGLSPIPLQAVKDAMTEVRFQMQDEIRKRVEETSKGKSPDDLATDAQNAMKEWVGKPAEERGRVETPRILALLQERRKTDVRYVAGGRVYRAEEGDLPQAVFPRPRGAARGWKLVSEESPEALPYTWPLAHNVRGAGQALGAKGCSDCHASGASFFFATVRAEPTGPDGQAVSEPMHKYLGMKRKAILLGAAAVRVRESGMRKIAVWIVLGILLLGLIHFVIFAPRAAAAGPDAGALPARVLFGPRLRWLHFSAFALFLALVATGVGFILTYGPHPPPGFFSGRDATRLHVLAGLAFAGLAGALALCWVAIGVVGKRAADWLVAWGGFLWMRGKAAATSRARLWVWFDILCCLALAATGVLMALREPSLAAAAGGRLRHLAEHPLLGPAAFALHGLAGTVMILRLAGHLYWLVLLRRRP